MKRRRLKTRQRTFLSTRMRIVAVAAVSLLVVVLLVIYFNFYDIKDSKAFSTGDYRTVSSGNWDDATVWEVFDGENWSPAVEAPGAGVRKIVVTNNQNLVVTDEIPLNELIIDEGSRVTIESNTIKVSKFNSKGGLTCNGTLEMGSAIIEGNGDLFIGPKAVLMIGSDAGIDKKALTGNVQMTGKKEYSKEAVYIFNGSVLQHTGNGLPSVIKNLVIDNPSGVTLDQQFQVLDHLKLVKGLLTTGRNSLTLGSSVLTPCVVEYASGSFSGNVKVWFGPQNINDLRFPLSDGYAKCQIGFTSALAAYQKGMIELVYRDGVPDDSHKSPFEARQVVVGITDRGYFSAMLSNGAEEGWFKLGSLKETASGVTEISWDINMKSDSDVPGRSGNTNPSGKTAKVRAISNVLYGPVPFTNKLVVRFYSDLKVQTSLQMIGAGGKVIQMENLHVEEGYNQFVFNAPGSIAPGDYMIQISNPSEIHTFKVLCNAVPETQPGS